MNNELINELRTSLLLDNSTLGNRAADALEAAQAQIGHWKAAHASAMFAGEQMKAMLDAQRASERVAYCV